MTRPLAPKVYRKETLGGRGIIYRADATGLVYDSLIGDWREGPGYKLWLMEIL